MSIQLTQTQKENAKEFMRLISGEDVAMTDEWLLSFLESARSNLTDREWFVLSLRFGLTFDERKTRPEVAKEFGTTEETIRQLESKAVVKTKAYYHWNRVPKEDGSTPQSETK